VTAPDGRRAAARAATVADRRAALAPAPPADRRPRPRLRVVDDARLRAELARRRRARLTVLGVFLAVVASLLGLAASHAHLVSGQSRLDDLEAEVVAAQARYSASRLEVAELAAPDRIVREARDRLGMVTPPSIRYVTPSAERAAEVGAATDGLTAEAPADAGAAWGAVKPYLGSAP
jgi:cell division protein FtsL